MTVAFDTLRFARKLRETAQFTPEQAECLVSAFAEALNFGCAPKSDTHIMRSDLHEAELRLSATIAASKAEIIRWLVGLVAVQTVAIVWIFAELACSGGR